MPRFFEYATPHGRIRVTQKLRLYYRNGAWHAYFRDDSAEPIALVFGVGYSWEAACDNAARVWFGRPS